MPRVIIIPVTCSKSRLIVNPKFCRAYHPMDDVFYGRHFVQPYLREKGDLTPEQFKGLMMKADHAWMAVRNNVDIVVIVLSDGQEVTMEYKEPTYNLRSRSRA